MNAENLRQTEVLQLGSPSGAATLAALFANCEILVKKITLVNGAALSASDTNFVTVSLMNGATLIASYSSKVTNGQGALSQWTGKAGAVAAGLVAAGSTLTAVVAVGGTGALTSAALQIEYVRNQNK
jgi:hypothetical protein